MITALRGSWITGALFPLAGVEGSRTLRHQRERELLSVAAKLDSALGGNASACSSNCLDQLLLRHGVSAFFTKIRRIGLREN